MISRWPGNDEGMPRGPVKSARYAKGLANRSAERDGCPYHVASGELSGDEYVDTGSPVIPEQATPQWVRTSYTKTNKKPSDTLARRWESPRQDC
jgi:hypothetical protein